MWSAGVVLFVMLSGYTPFTEEKQEKMFERIKQGDWKFDDKDWAHVSQDAKDLIKSLLETNPDKRATATQALNSKWIKADSSSLSSRDLSQSLRVIKEKRPRLKDLAKAFMMFKKVGISGTKSSLKNVNPLIPEEGSHQLT